MRTEGTSRKFGRRDIQRDIAQQFSDTAYERERSKRTDLIGVVQAVDSESKALTGRKKPMYAYESGVQETELFPASGAVLNIGDPWQTLDEPGITTIDYETGEEAQFARDPERFLLTTLECLMENLQNFVDHYSDNESVICEAAKKLLADYQRMPHPLTVDDLPRLAFWCQPLQEYIRESTSGTNHDAPYGRGSDPVRDLWYTAESLRTGLLDSHLMKTRIEPEIAKEFAGGRGSAQQREEFITQKIHEYRFQKKYRHAEFVHATFPDVPFNDHAFDRVVAPWSVSTHVFPVLTREQFGVYWDELDRILKPDGAAYMWPIYGGNDQTLHASLQEYVSRGGAAAIMTGGSVQWISETMVGDDIDAGTLVIFPLHVQQETLQRFLASVLKSAGNRDQEQAA